MAGAYLWTGARPGRLPGVGCFEQVFDHGEGRMITRVSSVGVRAGDQDRAVEFYVGKLGFEKRRDEPMGLDGRWVEVAPAGAETALVPFTPGL